MKALKGVLSEIPRRQFSDLFLFGFTLAELIALVLMVPSFTLVDWIYVLQHLVVFGIALTRRPPAAQDRSLPTYLAVAVACTYPYAQVIYLHWITGYVTWPEGGLILVTLSAFFSFASLLALGTLFGFRPALRGLATRGPYALVRHPMYLSYLISDIGYNLQESNFGTVALVVVGWASLIYRIRAEERILSQGREWRAYVRSVPYRLLPGVW